MEPITREFSVVLSKQADLVAELERLAKRAAKIGAPAITWEFGAVTSRKVVVDMGGSDRLVPFVALTLTGVRPQVNGWEFVATVEHLDGVNVLRHTPACTEVEIPETYRRNDPTCEHCNLARRRRDTYVLRSETGTWKEVGSSCLVDFLGHDNPHTLAAYAEMLGSALALCESCESDPDGGYGFGGGGPAAFALVEFLAHVAAEIRESGWTPKSAVPERPSASTAEMALDRIAPSRASREENRRDRSVTDSDRAVAEASAEWALGLETSGERLNDYLWNLFAVAKSGIVKHRTVGLAASIVAAHTKAEVRKRERAARKPSEHVGTVGETRSFALTLDRHFSFETQWGWVDRYIFRDADDCVFAWKASGDSSVIGLKAPDDRMVEGSTYILIATVKKHDDYKGTKQTVLTRAGVHPYTAERFTSLRDEETRKALGKKVRAGTATAEEVERFKALDAAARAAKKAVRAEVAKFAFFATTLRTVHYPATHEVVDAGHEVWVDCKEAVRYERLAGAEEYKPVVDKVTLCVHAGGEWVGSYDGKDCLDRARLSVAERLARAEGVAC